jgi:hypothetical protein
MTVRHSWDTTIDFMALKASWYFCVYSRKFLLQSFHVNLDSISLCIASFGRKTFRYQTSPRNLLTSLALVSVGQSSTLANFLLSASGPRWEMWCPRKSISSQNSFVFLWLTHRQASHKASMIFLMFAICSSILFDQIMMSSR